ncbi:hypothetical protein NPIL_360911 [Nephila pilipes]|uniref:Uncharacterized protein n=1 Tax=Nephila pilipes TaxID=299642 RepID=A0A8X6P254_NEPPI|nr:hypothetical protein NPIL_360911 [Nephila pilipes]
MRFHGNPCDQLRLPVVHPSGTTKSRLRRDRGTPPPDEASTRKQGPHPWRRKPFEKRENEMYQRSGFSLAPSTQNPVAPPNNALHLLSSLYLKRDSLLNALGGPLGGF